MRWKRSWSGQADDRRKRTRLVLRTITAPIFKSLRRMVHCARTIRVPWRPRWRIASSRVQAELVGPPSVARGAIGEGLELLFPDAVFHLAAGAAETLAERAAVTRQAACTGNRTDPGLAALGPCSMRAINRHIRSRLRAP